MAGSIVHYEVPAADVDRAVGFWGTLFGLNIGESMMPDFQYRMFQTGEGEGGAIMQSETPGSGLVVYLNTDDIDATVAKVRELGGTADDKKPVPNYGWFAACKDTEGNSFSLWQSDENAA